MASDFKKRMLEKNMKQPSVAEEINSLEPNREKEPETSDTPQTSPEPQEEPGAPEAIKYAPEPVEAPSAPIAPSQGTPKRTAVTLTPELDRYMRIRAKQLGISLDRYMNLLVSEERARIGEGRSEEEAMALYDSVNKRYRGSKEKTNITFSEENIAFLTREKQAAALNLTDYLNYIVEKEKERESREGKRVG